MVNSSSGIAAFPALAEAEGLFAACRFEDAARFVVLHLRAYPNEPRGVATSDRSP